MDGDSSRQENTDPDSSNMEYVFSSVLQSVRIRCGTVLADITDWKFMESQFYFVLLSGLVFWTIHLITTLYKN